MFAPNIEEAKKSTRYSQHSSSKPSSRPRGGVSSTQGNVSVALSSGANTSNHMKTKSTQLAHSFAGAPNFFQDGTYSVNASITSQQPSLTAKLVSKHVRHVSGSDVNTVYHQPSLTSSRDLGIEQKRQTTTQVTLSNSGVNQNPHSMVNNPKQNANGSIQIGHNRTNSSKVNGVLLDKLASYTQGHEPQKARMLVDTYQDYSKCTRVKNTADMSQQTNQSSVSNTQAGHKKSVSMANSKITQLLLKAGYSAKQGKNEIQKSKHKHLKSKVKQSEQATTLQQEPKTRKSSELINNIPNALQELSDDQIQRLLTFDERSQSMLSARQGSTYNDIVKGAQNGVDSSSGRVESFDKSNRVISSAKGALSAAAAQAINPVMINPTLIGPVSSERAGSIQTMSKVINSGPAVKKLNVQTKSFQNNTSGARTASVVESITDIPQNQSTIADIPKPVPSHSHQRTKSDQLSIQKALSNFGGNIIQNQQKKIGEILKNNLLDSAPGNTGIASANSGKHAFMNVLNANTVAPKQQVKSFNLPEQSSLTAQTQITKKPKLKQAEVVQLATKNQTKKSTKEKYNELKQQYDDLAEKYYQALAAAQTGNGLQEIRKQAQFAFQKAQIGSSLSSLSGGTLASLNVHPQNRLSQFVNQPAELRAPLRTNRESDLEARPQTLHAEPEQNDLLINRPKLLDPSQEERIVTKGKVESQMQIVANRGLPSELPSKDPHSAKQKPSWDQHKVATVEKGDSQVTRQNISVKQYLNDSTCKPSETGNKQTSNIIAVTDQNRTIDHSAANAQSRAIKAEAAIRHRRSLSDGNDPLMQFKFQQVQRSVLYSKNGDLDRHTTPVFHQIVGLDSVKKSNLSEEVINTINPPPSTQALQFLKNQEKINKEQANDRSQVHLARPPAQESLNILKSQHTRLKSDDISSKKRIKAKTIYHVNHPSAQDLSKIEPSYGGISNAPNIESQIRGMLSDVRSSGQKKSGHPIVVEKAAINKHRVIHKQQLSQHSGRTLISQNPQKNLYSDITMASQLHDANNVIESSHSPIPAASELPHKKHNFDGRQKASRSVQPSSVLPEKNPTTTQSQSFDPQSIVSKPLVNNLLSGQIFSTKEVSKQISRQSLRTVHSNQGSDRKKSAKQTRKNSKSDGKEARVVVQQLVHRGQPLTAQQPAGNQIMHHTKNKLSSTSESHQIVSKIKPEKAAHQRVLSGDDTHVRGQLLNKPSVGPQNDGKTAQSATSKRIHKRVKSDAFEARQQTGFAGQAQGLPSASFNNLQLPAKPLNEYDRASPALVVTNALQPGPFIVHAFPQGQNFFLGSNVLDGSSDDRKLVNVSIDLIDGQASDLAGDDMQNTTQLQGGQWYEIKPNQESKQAQEQLLMQFNKGRVKHKKNEAIVDNGHLLLQKVLNMDAEVKQPASSSEQQNGKQNSDLIKFEKYKNVLIKAKSKFQSKSEVPQSIVIQEDFQMNEEMAQFFLNRNPKPSPNVQANQLTTKEQHLQGENLLKKAPILLPNSCRPELANHQNMKIVEQDSRSDCGKEQRKPTVISKTPKPECFVPVNSVAQSLAPSEVNQSPDLRHKMIGFSTSKHDDEDFNGDRLQTQDSIANDPAISPREKVIKKLTKYIEKCYLKSDACPHSTIDFYRIGKVLGKGAFGKVNLALHQLTKRMVAIKSINKSYFNEEQQSTKVKQEVVILRQTRHRNIVKLYEYFETQKHILLVTEICAGGDLLNYVRKRRQLKEDVAKSVFKQIIEGIEYCHSKNILHRDIKLDNILLAWNGEIKIGDFGVSKVVKKGEVMNEQCGTPAYIAPEILMDRGYSGFGADLWSAGVVLYAMLYGTVPFRASNMSELQKIIIKAQYTLQDCISKEARNLLEGLLEKDPQKRLTIKGVLKHPWMKDAKDTVELFTSAEQNYIKTEYTYANTDRYNRNEQDNFMDGALETEANTELKNADTKSIILAPFNSTKSHIESSKSFLDEIRDMLQNRSCIYFVGKVREIDKQYEVNNNADLDNGVYHDFGKEDGVQKSPPKSSEKSAVKQTELEKLESMIRQEESVNFTHVSDEQPYECENEEGIPTTKQLEPSNSKLTNKDPIDESVFNAQMTKKALEKTSTLSIGKQIQINRADSQIVEQVAAYGYKADAVMRYLNNNELNSATTCYFLLCLPDIRLECRKLDDQKETIKPSMSADSLGAQL